MSVRIKGQAFLGFLAVVRELHGEEPYTQIVAQLDPALASALHSGELVAMGWYPFPWYASMHSAARNTCGERVSRELGRETTRRDVTTIYRFILRFFSPETLLKQAGKVFGLFCEGGSCTVEYTAKNTACLRYADCPGATRGVWDKLLGGTEMLVELCGGKTVSCKVLEGGGDGDPMLRTQVTWS